MRWIVFGALIVASYLFLFVANNTVVAEPEMEALVPIPNVSLFEKPRKYGRDQAVQVIEAHGYSRVSELKQGRIGIWRGSAVRYGQRAEVEVDRQGNFYDWNRLRIGVLSIGEARRNNCIDRSAGFFKGGWWTYGRRVG